MKKVVWFMHTSLDGFVADQNGGIGWIALDNEMFDHAKKQTDESDLALYGRVTFELMENYWPTAGDQPAATQHDVDHSRWYNKVPKVVLSRTMKGRELKNTRIISENAASEIRKLKKGPGKNIVIFGSPGAAHSLLKENLIDELWLFINPVLLGQGSPLFRGMTDRVYLELKESEIFPSGVIAIHYVRKDN